MMINCPKCKIPMENVERLGMGPKYKCEKCNLKLYQRGSTFHRLKRGIPDEYGYADYEVIEVKI